MAIADECEFLLDEYLSDDQNPQVSAHKGTLGGTNLSPEVLKMLQQMAPLTPVEKEEDEPDEIKVSFIVKQRTDDRYSMLPELILNYLNSLANSVVLNFLPRTRQPRLQTITLN